MFDDSVLFLVTRRQHMVRHLDRMKIIISRLCRKAIKRCQHQSSTASWDRSHGRITGCASLYPTKNRKTVHLKQPIHIPRQNGAAPVDIAKTCTLSPTAKTASKPITTNPLTYFRQNKDQVDCAMTTKQQKTTSKPITTNPLTYFRQNKDQVDCAI